MHEEGMEDGRLKKVLLEIDLICVGGVSDLQRRIDHASRISCVVDMERNGTRDVARDFDATTGRNTVSRR
jgi:hypothetical protein